MAKEKSTTNGCFNILQNLMILGSIYIVFFSVAPHIDDTKWVLNHFLYQTALFIVVAQLPSLKTGVMWWVDFAWPTGLMLIGIYLFLRAQTSSFKVYMVCACYTFQGFRMALGALYLIISGKWKTNKDLPRYQYQKIIYE